MNEYSHPMTIRSFVGSFVDGGKPTQPNPATTAHNKDENDHPMTAGHGKPIGPNARRTGGGMAALTGNQRPLPAGWRWVRLGEVCDFLDSRRIPINDSERVKRIAGRPSASLFPYYGANGQVGWIDDYLFDEPLILLAEDGGNFGSREKPIAYAVSGRYWVNNHAHVLKPHSDLDFDFCLHALRIRPDIGDMVSGSTRAKLNQEVAANIPVPLPPLSKQRRIAAILNEQMAAIERARAAAEAQLAAARELPAAYLREVFESEEARQWPKKLLGDAAAIGSGITLGRQLPPNGTRRVPYLRVANVKDGYLDLDDVYQIEATESEIAKCRLQYGDLLLTEGGDRDKLGRGTFWRAEIAECIHQNHIYRVRFDLDRHSPEFISAQIGSSYGKRYFLAHAKQTTGIATINQKVLGLFPLMVPPRDVQEQLATRLREHQTSTERLIRALQVQYDTVTRFPAALLRQAFSGEL